MDIATFQFWLQDSRRVSPRTAYQYARLVDSSSGNVTRIVARAHRHGTLRVALAAARLWARFIEDEDLYRKIDRARKRARNGKAILATDNESARVTAALCAFDDPDRSVGILVASSGLKLDDVFWMTREAVHIGMTESIPIERESGTQFLWNPNSACRSVFKNLSKYGSWEIVRDLLAPNYHAAYMRIRRVMRRACQLAETRNLPPCSFRRDLDIESLEGL